MLAYDSDDPRPRTPGLEKIEYKYEPPLSPSASGRRRKSMQRSSAHQESSDSSRRKRSRRHRPSQGDVVLWSTSYPNRPDIAKETGQRALLSNSDENNSSGDLASDEDDELSEESPPEGPADAHITVRGHPARHSRHSSGDNQDSRSRPGSDGSPKRNDSPTRRSPPKPHSPPRIRPSSSTRNPSRQYGSNQSYNETLRSSGAEAAYSGGQPSLPQHPHTNTGERGPWAAGSMFRPPPPTDQRPPNIQEPSSISMSAALRPHMITAAQGFSDRTLAAYQTDSPTTVGTSGAFTGPEQSLPPVGRLFDVADNPSNYQASSRPRTDSLSSHHSSIRSAPTPSVSYFPLNAPLSLVSPTPRLGRSHTDPVANAPPMSGLTPISSYTFPQISPSRANEIRPEVPRSPFSPTSGSVSSPARSGRVGKKPSNPTGPRMPLKRNRSFRALDDFGASSSTQGPIEYRCTYPDCRAQPFQTQYLLNSHKNVHSDDRPHFCPDQSCPRSEGGLGFKRKNEMLRHGLVHSSPGYHCPFCPDKEHRYPRPDNLQRHVRQHHEDIDANDPRFREILDQPRIGGSATAQRGRRRRTIDSQRDELSQ